MSYEANAHTNQMTILRTLLLKRDAGFAELQKVTKIESDAANFHIKQLMSANYITKNAAGRYQLTQLGKEYANRMDTDENVIEKQPKLSVAIIVENDKGEMLAQNRLKHPYFGYWGRITGKIRWGETVLDAAARELMEEAGLSADLEMRGIYHKTDVLKGTGELLEDKYFCLVYGSNPRGELIKAGEGHENRWMTNSELYAMPETFKSVPEITALACGNNFAFVEKTYEYDASEY